LVDEVAAYRQLAAGVQLGHPGAGAGAARRAVEPAGVDGHRVPRAAGIGAGGGEVDVVAAADPVVLRVHRLAGRVDRLHRGQARGQDLAARLAVERQPVRVEGDDRVEVAAVGQVVADLAVPGD